MTAPDRQAYVDGLRALAAVLEEHPEVPLPWDGTGSEITCHFLHGDGPRAAMAAAARAIPCAWSKDVRDDDYFDLHGQLAGLKIKLTAFRDAVCTRVVTGVSTVTEEVQDPDALAAVPKVTVTREVEEITWDCGSLLAPAAGGTP